MQFPAMMIEYMWQYEISRVLSSIYLVARKRDTCVLPWHLLQCCTLNPGLPPHMRLVVMVIYSVFPHGILSDLYTVLISFSTEVYTLIDGLCNKVYFLKKPFQFESYPFSDAPFIQIIHQSIFFFR